MVHRSNRRHIYRQWLRVYPTPSATTTYYASCKDGNCESSRIATNEVVVTTQPISPTSVSVNNTAICSGTAISLTATCSVGTITWYNQATGGTAIGTGNALSQSPSDTTIYYATCKNNNCESSRIATNQVVVTTQPISPTGVSINNAAICSSTAISLNATCETGTITWYNQATDGTAIGTGNNLSQTPAIGTTSYYVACENGNCLSSRAATDQVVVTAVPSSPTEVSVNNTAICDGTSVSLTATCATGTVKWFTQATGGVPIGTDSPSIQSPTVNTTYYASCMNGDCASSRVATSQVVVTAIPDSPTSVSVNNTAICSGTAISLTAACATGTIIWYNQATGGTSVGTGNALSVSPASTITYYASCKTGNCESSRVATNQVVVTSMPTNPTSVSVNNTTICNGTSISLTATCATGTVKWFTQATGGVSIGTGSPSIQSPTVNTTYYASCMNGDCVSSRVSTGEITVKVKPDAPVISGITEEVCAGTSVQLTATVTSDFSASVFYWTGGSSGMLITVTPPTSKAYKVVANLDGCISDSSEVFMVYVTHTPEVPVITADNETICKGNTTILTGSCPNLSDTFFWSVAQLRPNTPINPYYERTRAITEPGTYKGYCQTYNGCRSAETSITITQDSDCNGQNFIKVTPEKPVVCPNTSVTLSATGCTGTLTWTIGTSTTTGTSVSVTPSASTTYFVQCSTGGSTTVDVVVAATSVTVNANITTGKSQVKAVNTIESAKKIGSPNFSPSPNISYEAGKSIVFKPGFVVEAGSVFKAEIKGCN